MFGKNPEKMEFHNLCVIFLSAQLFSLGIVNGCFFPGADRVRSDKLWTPAPSRLHKDKRKTEALSRDQSPISIPR